MLLKLIVTAMQEQHESTAAMHVAADWLEENGKSTPELQHYISLLRKQQPKVTDWLSIIDKFGSGKERKQSQRVRVEAIRWFSPSSSKRKKRVKGWFHKDFVREQQDKRMFNVVLVKLQNAADSI